MVNHPLTTGTMEYQVDSTSKCSNPDIPILVFIDGINVVVTQRVDISRAMLYPVDRIGLTTLIRCQTVNTFSLGANPYVLLGIFCDAIGDASQRIALADSSLLGENTLFL